MQVPVTELIAEFARQARLPESAEQEDVYLLTLVADFASNSAMIKRDMRRLLEKDPRLFVRAACRVLRRSPEGPGSAYLAELLWSSPEICNSLLDPELLPLRAAVALAQVWVKWEPLLDIKLLHIGFPSDSGATDTSRARRALAIVGELPPERHLLLPLASLLRSPDAQVRLSATALYGRANNNPAWVRKRLAEADAEVRAHAVTSLWGLDSDAAGAVLREAARDPDPRVAANAWIGLHSAGAPDAVTSLKAMAVQVDPQARAAAAFAMGQTLHAGFRMALQDLLKDRDPQVRSQALQALIRVQRCCAPNGTSAPSTLVPVNP
jgi:hypothetical protein